MVVHILMEACAILQYLQDIVVVVPLVADLILDHLRTATRLCCHAWRLPSFLLVIAPVAES